MKSVPSLSSLIVITLLSISCNTPTRDPFTRETTAMNTFVSVTIYDSDIEGARAHAAIDSALAEVHRIELMASDYSDTSEVGRINSHAGVESVSVSPELVSLIEKSLEYATKSAGAFDVTVGPLVKAWDFLADHPRVPDQKVIAQLLTLVGKQHVSINGDKVFLKRRGMRLDLGAIAKGYAADRSSGILKRLALKRFIVDIGGNLSVFWDGTRVLDSTVAEILIRHPRKDGEFFGSFMMGTGGVSTSGDYQRYFVHKGVRYHHILNPATGYPAQGVVAVTIVASDATTADALSTLVFVLGREHGMEFIRNAAGVEGMVVWESGDSLVHDLSPGFEKQFIRSND